MDINTMEVRRVAKQIRNAADMISSLATGDVQSMKQIALENLKGMTAESLKEVLGDLGKDFTSIAAGLRTISNELTRYAAKVDEADAQAAQAIKQH